jgi:hypothetical protein
LAAGKSGNKRLVENAGSMLYARLMSGQNKEGLFTLLSAKETHVIIEKFL